jgi:hypothetical protein
LIKITFKQLINTISGINTPKLIFPLNKNTAMDFEKRKNRNDTTADDKITKKVIV